ncbi:hypothetical protein GCM10023155_10940 [Bremerella cremea]
MRSAIASFADSATLSEIDRSIREAKTASHGELPNYDLQELADAATRLTGRAELYSRGFFVHESDRETALGQLSSDQLKLIRHVADVAARSLRAATAEIKQATIECQDGISWAYELTELTEDNNMRARIDALIASPHSDRV